MERRSRLALWLIKWGRRLRYWLKAPWRALRGVVGFLGLDVEDARWLVLRAVQAAMLLAVAGVAGLAVRLFLAAAGV